MGSQTGPESAGKRRGAEGLGRRGIALIEFALILPLLLIIALAVIDFGRLIQTRLVVTNLAREGGSLASRQPTPDAALVTMLQASGIPLNLAGPNGRIYIARIKAGTGTGAAAPPTLTLQLTGGTLARGSTIGAGLTRLGLSTTLYNHLVYNAANQTSDLSEITVVEVYYKYRPITPLPAFMLRDVLLRDDGNTGLIVQSKSIF
jgi:Flp pilus assembly protein TadG